MGGQGKEVLGWMGEQGKEVLAAGSVRIHGMMTVPP